MKRRQEGARKSRLSCQGVWVASRVLPTLSSFLSPIYTPLRLYYFPFLRELWDRARVCGPLANEFANVPCARAEKRCERFERGLTIVSCV